MKSTIYYWNLALVLMLCCSFSISSIAGVVPPVKPEAKTEQLSKKDARKMWRATKKQHRQELSQLAPKARRAYLNKHRNAPTEPILPNPWLPVGVILMLVGGLVAILFEAPIIFFGFGIALVGLVFFGIWVVREINSGY